jgi:XTP/dITP diphosphohydrolase
MELPRLLIATNNKGKLEELQALLADLPLQLIGPSDIHLDLHVVEDGKSYAENASKKALAFSRGSGLIALADDSGLEVEALGNAPGLYSARYLQTAGASDADRRAYLLKNLHGAPRPWTARFRSTVAVATPRQDVQLAEGECRGEIIPEERGTGGFGYDPIFLLPEIGRTMGELGMEEKNCLSHRAQAILEVKPILKKIFDL